MKLIDIILEAKEIQYTKPNFANEWEEAMRYPEFEDMGKEEWIKIASQGKPESFSKIRKVLGNVDLRFDRLRKAKRERFHQAFEKGVIEMSIAVKFSDTDYDLVAGNTRLAGLVKNGVDPKLWIVDISHLMEMLMEGIDDPVKPGILKKRLGSLSCSKVRAEKSKLEDKGTHFAKALQRYLNYHCK